MRDLLLRCVLASASGVLYGLTFPPTSWTLLSWVALVPLLIAIRGTSLRSALFLSWLWCVVGACVAGSWFPRAVADYFEQPMVLALALVPVIRDVPPQSSSEPKSLVHSNSSVPSTVLPSAETVRLELFTSVTPPPFR